ncbi:hypothetical protein GUITHDRAFT_150853 [Guillardia theta CCMP2712]|uniref:Secreted protein n=1 Tax=Guillardia theta (strain CCMP2712) TaxID=905079 RepID=L1JV08_GUITC|nr:hypothetical protein GUITHDRAFT_150853 [Guillardia theta CCMP2712]EKX51918.1 hypothetical protein GUITHDRAFT_150853 [Guillardia theta CCMP2712]|eukprot:XP_005838898.1 hypothetical protein GUITHDRAFT_150853 [Guillardia theta CCMP2712]
MVGRMKHQDSIAMGLLLLCGLLVRQASCEEPTITIFSPIDGAVITGGGCVPQLLHLALPVRLLHCCVR